MALDITALSIIIHSQKEPTTPSPGDHKMPLYVPKSATVAVTAGQLKAIFKEQDADGNGRLTKEELRKAYEKLGSRNPDWRVRRSLSHADTDGDGSISLEELDEVVKYALKQGYNFH
ncbi:hypothetical protein ACOSQ2_011038 [Xanthoceras sorbifolium]|uniref:EF-hand domain-containing protein n=1 Tax=Xanthoceras sorbifolium TaxID=99658 RepID=A0ABQ8HSY3_9ROSI|nr:hypothetical protein JRO89_XS07G0065300 [Xanthoceras sorbifolium]